MCNFLEYKGASHSLSCECRARGSWLGKSRGEGTDSKIVYRRYASLFFVCGIGQQDNELITLEVIHRWVERAKSITSRKKRTDGSRYDRYVEVLDRYFGNVCELDLWVPLSLPTPSEQERVWPDSFRRNRIFNYQKAYSVISLSFAYLTLPDSWTDWECECYYRSWMNWS